MTNPEVAIFMLSLFIVLVLLGFPIAFTLLAMGVGFGYYAYYNAELDQRIQRPVQQSDLLSSEPEHLFGDGERRSGRDPAVPVHGLRGRAGQYRRPAVPLAATGGPQPAGLDGNCGADHLRGVLNRQRHCRRGGNADGPAGLSGHGAGQLQQGIRIRRDLRRRHARHSHTAVDHADRLCRHRGAVAAEALRRGGVPRAHAGRLLYSLRSGAGTHQSVDCATAQDGRCAVGAADLSATSDFVSCR